MNTPYTVALRDAEEISTQARITAESRFAASLERALGGPDQVAATFRAWLEVEQSEASVLTSELAALACKWPAAARTAEQAGMRDLGHFGGMPHFEVRLSRALA